MPSIPDSMQTITQESIPHSRDQLHNPPPQAQQGTKSLPRASRACRSRSTSPPQENDISTKDMLKSASQEMIVEEFRSVSTSAGITTMGKSEKILNGVNQYSMRAYARRKINEEVPEMFCILDSNLNLTTKVQALEDHLNKAQSANAMVCFTLQKELVKEFMQHVFYSDPLEDNMMHGFTPFCIQCMDKKSKYSLISLEKRIDLASHMVEADFDKKEAALKINPSMDALGLSQRFPIPESSHGHSSPLHPH